MLNKSNQEQTGGDNSQNIQVAGNLIIGITESSAREIALEVYKENFIKLSDEAKNTAFIRVEELVDDFLIKLHERSPHSLQSLKEPGMQMALFTAQKEYAKTGDKDLEETLVDLLVDRAATNERDLKQIVLDESISTVSKLTTKQLDVLTLVFITTRTQNNTINNIPSFIKYLKEYFLPFLSSLTVEASTYDHLVYAGASSFMGIAYNKEFEQILKNRYKGIFFNGFTKEEFESSVGNIEDYKSLIMRCLHFPEKFQLNCMTEELLEKEASAQGIEQTIIERLKQLYLTYVMSDKAAKEFILSTVPEMKSLMDHWESSDMNATSLTSVGVAIANANFRRKTGMPLDLSIWIN